MRGYFEQRYSPIKHVLGGDGKIDFDQLVRDATKILRRLGNIRKRTAVRHELMHMLVSSRSRKKSPPIAYVVQIANAPAAEDDDRFAARIIKHHTWR